MQVGGGAGLSLDETTEEPKPEGQRINMVTAIRRVLEQELESNPRVLVFGEDVGPKGGVHAVTLGLQERFGRQRVFDTPRAIASCTSIVAWARSVPVVNVTVIETDPDVSEVDSK